MVSTSFMRFRWQAAMRLEGQSKKDAESSSKSIPTKTPNRSSTHINSKLREKYGELEAVVGDVGENSVYTVRRLHDGTIFAVKRFGRRRNSEDEAIYQKKILGEFFLGSQLRHRHVIRVLELFEGHSHWEQVMEYAAYNLFDRACSKKMGSAEIDCSFKQIVTGVAYLHSKGLAHRDLKLENVVYTQEGVLKLIDFGTASITGTTSANVPPLVRDYVGCRPYMAPEVISRNWYNPQIADVWSLAIIYCCLVMGKFPWMVAQCSDDAFASFVSLQSTLSHTDQPLSDLEVDSSQTVVRSAQKVITESSASIICTTIDIRRDNDDTKTTCAKSEAWGGLPQVSWVSISRLLQIDCHRRWGLKQFIDSPWFRQIQVCCWDDDKLMVGGCAHQHL